MQTIHAWTNHIHIHPAVLGSRVSMVSQAMEQMDWKH